MKQRTKFSKALIVCRMTLGLPQEKFSKLLKISPAAVGQWERGYATPSAKQIPKLAEILKLTPLELLDLIEEDEELI
jgi:transcriptional regulator with XRE-family HTH domain